MSSFRPGDRILARWRGDRFWFPGVVQGVNGADVAVQYDDGMSDIRPTDQVRPFDWAPGSAVSAVWDGDGQWYGGRILAMDSAGRNLRLLFEDDGAEQDTPRARRRAG